MLIFELIIYLQTEPQCKAIDLSYIYINLAISLYSSSHISLFVEAPTHLIVKIDSLLTPLAKTP